MIHTAPDQIFSSSSESHNDLGASLLSDTTDAITVPDAHLLFSGDFKRAGIDLILSDAQHEFTVRDYFRNDHRPMLLSPDGAQLSSEIVESLTGHGSYAQAGPQQANSDVVGRVATVQGNVTVVRNGVAVGLNAGDGILEGDVLQTGTGSLGVTFNDGSTLTLTPGARLVVNEFVFDPNGSSNSEVLNLVQGSLTFISGQIAHNGSMKIGTPVATMGIRGTVGGVTDANDGTVHFYVVQSDTGAFILDNIGNTIAQVVQNGPLIVIHPAGPLQVVAEEVQKTPAELATELAALQQVVSVQSIGQQIIQQFQQNLVPQSNDHPHTQIEITIPTVALASHATTGSATGSVIDNNNAPSVTVATTVDQHGNTTYQDFFVPSANLPPLIIATVSTGQALGDFLSPVALSYLTDNHNLINSLGGPNGFGNVVTFQPDYSGIGGQRSDDGSSKIDLASIFGAAGLNFFGTSYNSIYINNNGNITFVGPDNAYVPVQISNVTGNPIIAPFWADVDTRAGPAATNTGGNSTGSNLVYYSLDQVNHVVTITWDDVGYYNQHTNALDAFQLQLIGLGDGNFDIVFRYEAINWTSGDASAGFAAQAGYSAGDGNPAHYFGLPQSGNAAMLLALPTTEGNTGIAGVDVFQVLAGTVAAAPIASGQIQFVDPDSADTHTATFIANDTGYVGTMTLDDPTHNNSHVTESTGATPGSVAWHLDLTPEQIQAIPVNQTITQSYNVTITDAHNNITAQEISVSIGGPGNDNFVFTASQHSGADTIANFSPSVDTIELDGYNTITNANIAAAITSDGVDASHGNAVINLGHGDSVTVAGVTEVYLQQHLNLIHLNSGVV